MIPTNALFKHPSHQLGPAYEGEELGIGDSFLMKAIKEATGRSMDKIKADVQEHGDIGTVAQVLSRKLHLGGGG